MIYQSETGFEIEILLKLVVQNDQQSVGRSCKYEMELVDKLISWLEEMKLLYVYNVKYFF